MFIIHDFNVNKFIDDHNYDSIFKTQPSLLPNFDEERFPFILLAGYDCISIVNVKNGFHQPLVNQNAMDAIGN